MVEQSLWFSVWFFFCYVSGIRSLAFWRCPSGRKNKAEHQWTVLTIWSFFLDSTPLSNPHSDLESGDKINSSKKLIYQLFFTMHLLARWSGVIVARQYPNYVSHLQYPIFHICTNISKYVAICSKSRKSQSIINIVDIPKISQLSSLSPISPMSPFMSNINKSTQCVQYLKYHDYFKYLQYLQRFNCVSDLQISGNICKSLKMYRIFK